MADWSKFWGLLDEEIPSDAIRPAMPNKGIWGDYLEGQYVVQRANQICREADLSWGVDMTHLYFHRVHIEKLHYIVTVMGSVYITDGERTETRPGCGVGRAKAPVDRETGEILPITAQQIDTAEKGALTDLVKNAFVRFGRALGGELYFDERMAEVLGWELESDHATNRREDTPHSPAGAGEDLGGLVVKYPWGKDKRFEGWTLEEVYNDPDGRGAMAWCAEDPSRQGNYINKKFAEYYNMRIAQEEESQGVTDVPDGTSLEEFDKTTWITVAGRRVKADDLVSRELAKKINGLIQSNLGEGKLFHHANHVRNHLKAHFRAAKVVDLTNEKAKALLEYIESGGKKKDPRWYEDATKSVEDLFGVQDLEELVKECATNLPEQWQDRPLEWWRTFLKQFGISERGLNNRQIAELRNVLEVIKSGIVVWPDAADKDSRTYQALVMGMQKVKDGS